MLQIWQVVFLKYRKNFQEKMEGEKILPFFCVSCLKIWFEFYTVMMPNTSKTENSKIAIRQTGAMYLIISV